MRSTARLTPLLCCAALLLAQTASADDAGQALARPITITVVDENGQPLKGATVALRQRGDYPKGETVDESGRRVFQCGDKDRYVSILARADGHVPMAATWDSPNRDPVELPAEFTLRLPRAKHISGQVTDEAGKAVEGAKVFLSYWPNFGDREQVSPVVQPRIPDDHILTDAQGRWSYNGYPPDSPKLNFRVEHPDFIRDGKGELPAIAALLDGSAVTVLERGVDVAGTVVGPDGKPVVGARATTIRHSYISNDYGKDGKTDEQGRFVLTHLRPGITPVTVMAKGFGPEMQSVDMKPGMEPVAFKLAPGKTLRGRVVDPQGKPLKGAMIHLRGWRHGAPLRWQGPSDADGHFTMPDAPADAMEFHIVMEGYRSRIDEDLTARDDDQPVVVRLDPEIKISGTVIDADSKQPIEKFRVIEGYTFRDNYPPSFSFDEAQPFKGGKYEFTSDAHEQVVATCVRIEADGYVPAVSPASPGESFTFNAVMRRGRDVTGTLRSPDGKPVANASVKLTYPGAQVDVWENKIERCNGLSAQTDADGRFRFPPQTGDIFFFAIHDAGFVMTKGDVSAEANDLTLVAWSGITGVYAPYGKPLADKTLDALVDPIREPRDPSPRLVWRLSDVRTDSAGRFYAKCVPSFAGEAAVLMIGQLDSDSIDERRWVPVELKPGQTLRLEVAGGRTVAGRIVPATPADKFDGQGWMLLKRTSNIPPELWSTDIFAAASQAESVYRSHINPDGTFTVPCLEGGRYEYDLTYYKGETYASACGVLKVDSGEGVTDVGEIHYARKSPVKVGEAAPELLGRTFSDEPLRLSDYSGKFVVVAVWDSCTGRSDAHLPFLNELPVELGTDALEKVALLSVNLDAISCGMNGIPRRPHTLSHSAWVKGYVPMSDQSVVNKLGQKKWPVIVIIGPDGKLAARDLDARDVAGELKKLINK